VPPDGTAPSGNIYIKQYLRAVKFAIVAQLYTQFIARWDGVARLPLQILYVWMGSILMS